TKHTRRFMRSEHYQPQLSDRSSRERWEAEGKKAAWQRAAEVVKHLLEVHSYRLPAAVRQQIVSEIPGISA
ncbi:MAG TPA: trimethylamine methyltransferase, partial [Dehalococcoidia bacterium]|nr:trimethylamine methyltransferase [Dehalococcoidia bacterium]